MSGWAITGTVVGICIGIIVFALLIWWFNFTYCWMNEMAASQERIADALDKIAGKNSHTGKEPVENANPKEGGGVHEGKCAQADSADYGKDSGLKHY